MIIYYSRYAGGREESRRLLKKAIAVKIAVRNQGGLYLSYVNRFDQSIDHKAGFPYPKNRPLIDLADENCICNNITAPSPVLPVIVTVVAVY